MSLLSIVIPTFNRCVLLKKTLDQLSAQIEQSDCLRIEIVVSDNASSDTTKDMVNNWIYEHKQINISYIRNQMNIGFDSNCLSGARKAKGKFVWFMSDDDSLVEGALGKVYETLNQNQDIVFMFINYSMITPGFDEYFPCKFKNNLLVSPDQLMVKTKFAFGFISSCVFNRKVLCSLYLEEYIGSNWIQLYAVKLAALKGVSLILAEPLIKMRRQGLQESRKERKSSFLKIDKFMHFHLSYLDFLESFKGSRYSKETLRSIKNFGWDDNLNQIISLKLTSESYNFEEIGLVFLRMAKYFSHKLTFWILHVPILVSPKFVSIVYFFFKLKYIKLKKIIRNALVDIGIMVK